MNTHHYALKGARHLVVLFGLSLSAVAHAGPTSSVSEPSNCVAPGGSVVSATAPECQQRASQAALDALLMENFAQQQATDPISDAEPHVRSMGEMVRVETMLSFESFSNDSSPTLVERSAQVPLPGVAMLLGIGFMAWQLGRPRSASFSS
jgi:hypothetical protein